MYTIRTYDTSSEPKTAENLLKMLREVLLLVQKEWHVIVIAITSDSSGESRKARVEIVKELPHLVAPDCYAHQASLCLYYSFNSGCMNCLYWSID